MDAEKIIIQRLFQQQKLSKPGNESTVPIVKKFVTRKTEHDMKTVQKGNKMNNSGKQVKYSGASYHITNDRSKIKNYYN